MKEAGYEGSNESPLLENEEIHLAPNIIDDIPKEDYKPAIEQIKTGDTIETSKYKSTSTLKIHKTTELSMDCTIGPDAAPAELLSDIIKVNMTVLDPLLNIVSSCFRRLSVEQIMVWQKKELDQPLLKMPERLKPIAVQMFRNLLSYMTDRKSSKKPINHAKKFLKLTLHSEKILKDEAYLQTLKQIKENKKYDSLMRGWKFLAILSSCFVPSKDIYHLILNFLFFELQNNDDGSIINHAKYIFVRMIKTNLSERKNVPCVKELEYIEILKPIQITISFFSGSETNVTIESYTTVKDIKKKMMDVLDFNPQKSIYYSVYEVCSRSTVSEERFLDDSEKVCDVISLWKTDMDKATKKNELIEFKLYLKLLVYYPFDEEDLDTISVVYYQTLYDVLSGKFKLNDNQITTLAALQVLNEFGTDGDSAFTSIQRHTDKYIPSYGSTLNSNDQWAQKIMEMYNTLSSYSKNQAKWNYLEQLKKVPTYQAQQFDARFNLTKSGSNDDNIPEECVIGIKPEGIMIFDQDRNELVFYKYESIMNWGISKDQLIICVSKEDNELKKVCFFTSQTKVIQTLLVIYCNILVGKGIKEIQEILKGDTYKMIKIEESKIRRPSKYKKATAYSIKPLAFHSGLHSKDLFVNEPINEVKEESLIDN